MAGRWIKIKPWNHLLIMLMPIPYCKNFNRNAKFVQAAEYFVDVYVSSSWQGFFTANKLSDVGLVETNYGHGVGMSARLRWLCGHSKTLNEKYNILFCIKISQLFWTQCRVLSLLYAQAFLFKHGIVFRGKRNTLPVNWVYVVYVPVVGHS